MELAIIMTILLAVVLLGRPLGQIRNTGLLTKGLRSEFFERFKAAPVLFPDLTTKIPSTADKETHRFLGAVPRPREWIGPRRTQGMVTSSYDVANKKFESTVEVKREEIDDDQTGQIRIRIGELAQAAAQFPDELLSNAIENGGTDKSYDGKSFFATDHAIGSSGTMDNALTVDISTIDAAATPSVPTTKAMKHVIEQLTQQLRTFKDEQGRPLNMSLEGLLLVVPPNWEIASREALNAAVINSTSNVLTGIADLRTFPWLTSTDRGYLFKNNEGVRPFILQERDAIEFTAKDKPDDDNAFELDSYLYGTRWRMALAYGRFQHAIRMVMT